MRICITLDDVLRAKTRQFGKIYKKAFGVDDEFLENRDFSTNDLCEVFGFESREKYNEFLYKDYPFEIFAEALPMERMLDKNFNLWTLKVGEEYQGVEFLIANPFEFNTSIGYTCFFLSQIATRIREFYFPKDSSDIWKKCDVLITAEPKLLKEKPFGKIVVKIDAPYNEGLDADLTYESLSSLISDEKFLTKVDELVTKNNDGEEKEK